jgi:hypothetical protein
MSDVTLLNITSEGIISINKGNNVNICNSIFEDINSFGFGGGLFLENISKKIEIINNTFININNSGDGGAIYFSTDTYFEIILCEFNKCVSINGFGGAITSTSKSSNSRLIKDSTFSENSALNNIGIDIYDASYNSRVLYTRLTVINCSSNSTEENEYILFAGAQV